MICRYETPDFKTLQLILSDFLDEKNNDTAIISEKRNLSAVLSRAINKANIDRLCKLDELNLTYNSWSSNDRAINENLLASYNIILLRIIHGEKIEKFGFDSIIESLYLILYADFYEASLIITEFHDKKFFEDIISQFNYYIEQLSPESLKRLNCLWFEIPKNVFTVHLNQHLDENVLEVVKNLKDHDGFMEQNLIASNSLKQDIEEIKKSLKDQKSEYNFIGLSSGFKDLKKQKAKELCTQNWIHYLLMLSVIAIIVIKFIWSINYLENSNFDNTTLIVTTISAILVVFIILYFFRITLINIKSVKSQILQIDLRLTLCQFIHNYETDTTKLRSKDMKESFDRFESVIFAPIVATEDQMPATFDGLEQLTGIIGSFNKGSK